MKKVISALLILALVMSMAVTGMVSSSAATARQQFLMSQDEVTNGDYTPGATLAWDSDKVEGSGSVVVPNATGNKVVELKDIDVSTAVQRNGYFWVYIEDASKVKELFWCFSSNDAYNGDCVRYIIRKDSVGKKLENGWNKIEFTIHDDTAITEAGINDVAKSYSDDYAFYKNDAMLEGSVDWANINYARIVVGRTEATTVKVNALTFNTNEGEEANLTYSYNKNTMTARVIGHTKRITDLVIPETVQKDGNTYTVTGIDYCALINCTTLTNVTIPDSVTFIGVDAFSGCSSLTSVSIPAGVTQIGYSAFAYCSSLKVVDIADSVETIDSYAFGHCTSLTSITLPDSVTGLQRDVFYGCSSLKEVNVSSENESFCSVDGVLFNKEKTELILHPINKGSTEYTVADGVTTISFSAFENCTSLKKVILPESVTTIRNYAFRNCTALSTITVVDDVKIYDKAFYNTAYYNDESNWTGDVLYFGNALVKANTSLSGAYTVSEGTATICENAFENCTSLTEISIPESVTSIGLFAFDKCTSLTRVNITDIEKWLAIPFSGVSANPLTNAKQLYLNGTLVTELVIPETVTEIGDYTFYNSASINDVTIPESVTQIGAYAFMGCDGIKNVEYEGSMTQWKQIVISVGNEALTSASIVYLDGSVEPTAIEVEKSLDKIIVSNAWVNRYNNNLSARNALHTSSGGKIQFSFYGIEFGIVSYLSPSQGKVYVSIDGGEEFLAADLYSDVADTYFKETVYTSDELALGTHTVTVRVEGKAYMDAINITGELVKCETPIKDDVTIEVENILDAEYTGTWTKKYAWKHSGHNAMYSTNGGTVTFDFEGDELSVLSYKASTQGKLYVSIDGGAEVEVSLYDESSDTLYATNVFSTKLDTYGTHTVTVRTEGKAYVDAVVIRRNSAETVTYEGEGTELTLEGDWSNKYSWKHSNHNAMFTSTGGTASFTYTGYDFRILSYKAKTQGKMYVSIDGGEAIEVDLYHNSTDTKYKEQVFEAAGLDFGTHTVTITTSGKVYLDAVKIDGVLS